jgi:molybdate transport system ATP-binding protein
MSADLAAQFIKRFGTGRVIEGNLCRPTDRFSVTVLFGPSGCGKTTTLRCLAGLERPEKGRITFGQALWFDAGQGVFLTPQQRDIGYLFQEYALFPHLTVARNIAYGLRGISRDERRRRVGDMLDRFRLAGLANRYPQQASGGEQQRIALARVLARRPRLLLLDEPLSALDQPTREQLRPELRGMLVQFGIPVVLVTHDRIEAMALADHLLVLDHGRVLQQGSVEEVFSRPADADAARIVGVDNVLPGRVAETVEGIARVAVGQTHLFAVAPVSAAEEVFVCIRPEDIVLQKGTADQASARNRLPGKIGSVTPEGPLMRVALDCGFPLISLVTRMACAELELREGESVAAIVKAASIHLIARALRRTSC